MSAVGLVTVTPPELKSVRGEDVVKFDLAYERYLRQVSEVNLNRPNSQRVTAAGYKVCISSELLESLVSLRTFPDCNEVQEVTNFMIKDWVKDRSRCSVDDMAMHVNDAMSRVKFKVDRSDPKGASLQFFADVMTQLRRSRVPHATTDAGKALITELLPKLEPVIVRDTISASMQFWPKDEKYDFHHFMKKVTEACVESAKYVSKRPREDHPDTKQRQHRHKKKKRSVDGTPTKEANEEDKSSNQGKNPFANWTLPCLNPICDGVHPISKCDLTSVDDKKRLLKEYREKRKAEKRMKKAAALRTYVPGDGRWEAILEDKVKGVALGDSGSDCSAVDRSTVEQLKATGVEMVVKDLEEKIELDAAIKLPDSVPFTSSATTVLDITILLPCGPLRLRNVPFHIVDQKMDEILLGRPLLKALGYDVERHLSKLRKQHVDIDVSKKLADLVNSEKTNTSPTQKAKAASGPYRGLWYGRTEDDPIQPPDSIGANIGEDSEDEVREALRQMVSKAAENGMTAEGLQTLRGLLEEYRDIFRIKLGPDPPADVRPMEIKLRDNHRPHRSTQRRYAPPQRAFISSTIRKLEEVKAVYSNPNSRWASPALAVAKPGPEQFRFTVDLRGPNKETMPVASAMPDMEGLIQSVAGSTVFAKLDMCHAYWQIPLHPNSQECMSIQTPLGVFTPTRSLHGSTDSGNHFQACMSEVFATLSDSIVHWQDDALAHAEGERSLIKVLRTAFSLCRKHGLKLHAKKCQLFLHKARFCGRIIDSSGIKYDPQCLEALIEMKPPQVASDLQQFICAVNWMRSSIPDFSRVVAPLHRLMEECYTRAGKRTKRAVKHIKLSELWGTVHDATFAKIKQMIAHRVKLAHPREGHTLCLFSDASETHWGSVLTQVKTRDMKKPIEEQDHEPLSFQSGCFTGSLLNWSTVEKEAYAIVESISRLQHFTAGSETTIFTDHANLVYIFDPIGQHPGIGKHVASKLMRWALKLSGYRYVIEHVSGEDNVWADILTRWGVRPRNKARSIRMARVMHAPINPGRSDDEDWPTRESIAKSQTSSNETPPKGMSMKDGIVQNEKGVVFIPCDDHLMKLRIIIAAHTGMAGHRGRATTKHAVASHFIWKSMDRDIEDFCRSCLHCLSSYPGHTIARPMGHSIHAEKPNEVIHFDYCYIGAGINGAKYVLVLKDDLSSYVWLVVCDAADGENTVEALVKWFTTFGVVPHWVSDSGSHFKNEVMTSVRRKLKGSHHFTLPYCPWTNGTVEVVCRELVRCMKAIISELKLPMMQWPETVPLVQSALNNSPLERLGGRCPLNVFTGLPSGNPVTTLRNSLEGKPKTVSIQQARAAQLIGVQGAHRALDEMHRDVFEKVSAARQRKIDTHNRKTHVRPCNLDVGDYVLRGKSEKMMGRKLMLRWTGPFMVSKVMSEFLFQIEDLQSRKKTVVHGTRLKFFRNSSFEVNEECKEQLAFQKEEYCVVEELQDIRLYNGEAQLLVKWVGFEDEDPQWEPLGTIREDVPELFRQFVQELKLSGTVRQKKLLSSMSL